jgi:hypothetical protein
VSENAIFGAAAGSKSAQGFRSPQRTADPAGPSAHQFADALPRVSREAWTLWACGLVGAYVLASFAGWMRTLDSNEVWALYFAARPFSEQLHAIRGDLVHPPLMYFIERGWLAVFGQSDDAAKALVLTINIPTLVLFTWLAASVTRYWRAASFLFASIYFQPGSTPTQVRMYGLGLLLTVLSTVLWVRWREQPSNTRLLAWAGITALLLFTHLFGSFLLVAFVIVNWLFGRRRAALTAVAGILGLTIGAWFLYVLPVYQARGLHANVNWVSTSPWRAVSQLPILFLGTLPGDHSLLLPGLAAIALEALLLLSAWRVLARTWPPGRALTPAHRWFWASVVLAGAPVFLLLAFSLLVSPAFHARFVLGTLPAYWLAIVLLAEFARRPGRVILYGVLLPWVLICTGAELVQVRAPSKVRQASAVLLREGGPHDLLLVDGLPNEMYWEWTHRLGRVFPIQLLDAAPDSASDSLPEVAQFAELPKTPLEHVALGDADRVWLFLGDGNQDLRDSEFLRSRGFVRDKTFPAERPFLERFQKRNATSAVSPR